jgi:hypothetical protein
MERRRARFQGGNRSLPKPVFARVKINRPDIRFFKKIVFRAR